jgi:hypothetical protein
MLLAGNGGGDSSLDERGAVCPLATPAKARQVALLAREPDSRGAD